MLCADNCAYLALHSVLLKFLHSAQMEMLIGDDEVCLFRDQFEAHFNQREQLLAEMDAKGNGVVNYAEFVRVILAVPNSSTNNDWWRLSDVEGDALALAFTLPQGPIRLI